MAPTSRQLPGDRAFLVPRGARTPEKGLPWPGLRGGAAQPASWEGLLAEGMCRVVFRGVPGCGVEDGWTGLTAGPRQEHGLLAGIVTPRSVSASELSNVVVVTF